MPRPVGWLAFALWLAAAGLLGGHARRAAWGPAEALLGYAGWLLLPVFVVPGEVRRLFGPVFLYEVIRLGRRPLTFALRGLYVVLLMGLLVWMYLLWLDSVNGYQRRQRGYTAGTVAVLVGCVAVAGLAVWLFRGWWRRGAVLVVGGVAAVAAVADTAGGPPVPPAKLAGFATYFFTVFVFIQFGVVALLTPAYVAGSVADEKERKTLEFLLATDLAPREILFGKLVARVVSLLMFVLAGLPVVAFLQLFGGIDPELLLTVTAAAAVQVLGFSAVSMYVSTTVRKPRDAIALSYLLLAGYLFLSFTLALYLATLVARFGPAAGPWTEQVFGYAVDMYPVVEAAAGAAAVFAQGNPVFQVVMLLNPFLGTGGLTPPNMAAALGRFALFWAVVGGLAMAYSVWRLRPIALGHGKAPTQKAIDKQARRRPAVGSDPMLWKEVFLEGGFKGGCVGWLTAALIVGLVFMWPPILVYEAFFGNTYRPTDPWAELAGELNGWCRAVTAVVGTLLLLATAVRGAGVVSGERDKDTWISLMATPLGAWEMLRGKWLGCVLGVRRGVAVLVLAWAIALAGRGVEPAMVLALAAALVVYVGTFAWVGIFCSLTSRTTLRATVKAAAAAALLVGGFWVGFGLCCLAPLALVAGGGGRDYQGLAQLILGCTPAVVLGWVPVQTFDRHGLDPFGRDDGPGVLAPIIGLLVWAGFGLLLGRTCLTAFARVTNRGRDDVPTGARPADPLPRPPR